MYSGSMYTQLKAAVPDSVLFGDIAYAAYGTGVNPVLWDVLIPRALLQAFCFRVCCFGSFS